MKKKTALCSHDGGADKHTSHLPLLLTAAEAVELMRAFTAGKTAILEEDALMVLGWANAMRLGALLLQMVLEQRAYPVIENGAVTIVMGTPPGEA